MAKSMQQMCTNRTYTVEILIEVGWKIIKKTMYNSKKQNGKLDLNKTKQTTAMKKNQ